MSEYRIKRLPSNSKLGKYNAYQVYLGDNPVKRFYYTIKNTLSRTLAKQEAEQWVRDQNQDNEIPNDATDPA